MGVVGRLAKTRKKTAATAEGLKGKGSPRLRREGVKVARPHPPF